jgi:hypothetical protein
MPRLAVLALVAVAVGLVACGGDDSSSSDSKQGDCAASFNSASPTFRRIAALSHVPNNNVVVGAYNGPRFAAHAYDRGLRADPAVVSVKPGDCVITEVSPTTSTVLYGFVRVDGAWHRLSETDPGNALSKNPKAQLKSIQEAQLQVQGADAQLATAD